MKQRQIVLKLVLDQLGVSCDLSTFSDRIIPQKAIYLVQKYGIHLGYYFGKYALGPYSPELEDEMMTLREDLSIGDNEYLETSLVHIVDIALIDVKSLMTVPKSCDLDQERWITLLSSVIYEYEYGDTIEDVESKLCFDSVRMMENASLAFRVAIHHNLIQP